VITMHIAIRDDGTRFRSGEGYRPVADPSPHMVVETTDDGRVKANLS
jgi:hypothetical protein